jgi:hypothetical protein
LRAGQGGYLQDTRQDALTSSGDTQGNWPACQGLSRCENHARSQAHGAPVRLKPQPWPASLPRGHGWRSYLRRAAHPRQPWAACLRACAAKGCCCRRPRPTLGLKAAARARRLHSRIVRQLFGEICRGCVQISMLCDPRVPVPPKVQAAPDGGHASPAAGFHAVWAPVAARRRGLGLWLALTASGAPPGRRQLPWLRRRLGFVPRPGAPVRILIFGDELQPGNVLRPDPGRKLWAWYWTIADLPPRELRSEAWWLPLAFARSSEVDKLGGALGAQLSEQRSLGI